MGCEELNQAHLYILNNTQEVIPYKEAHKEFVKISHSKMTKKQVLQEHNKSFLAHDPLLNVQTWKGYDISNYSFYTKS